MPARLHYAPAIPVAPRGVALGRQANGEPVVVPFFTAARGTAAAVIGDPALPKLVAMRALGGGARLQVVTSNPAEWLRLRGYAGLSADRLVVVRPGTPPPVDGTATAPWMVIDDAGGSRAVTVAALRGLDAVVLYRSTPASRAAVVAALSLPDPVVRSLHGIPGDVAALACRGTVRLVPLRPDASERAVLAELGSPISRSSDCRLVPGLARMVSFETKGMGVEGEVA